MIVRKNEPAPACRPSIRQHRLEVSGKATHGIVQVSHSNIQARSRLVGLRIVDQHRFEAVVELNYPILAVILRRLADGLGEDVVRRRGRAGDTTPFEVVGGGVYGTWHGCKAAGGRERACATLDVVVGEELGETAECGGSAATRPES